MICQQSFNNIPNGPHAASQYLINNIPNDFYTTSQLHLRLDWNLKRLVIIFEYSTHFEITLCIDPDGIQYVCTTKATARTSLIIFQEHTM